MGTYLQSVNIPGIEVTINQDSTNVTIDAPKGSWTFVEGRVISFKGLDTCFMIYKVYPNGVTLISSSTSVPRFHSWRQLFSGNNIFNDCVRVTGWMVIK